MSTDHEEQDSSIELQEHYYGQLINDNPKWENAGVFAERVTGLRMKERTAFKKLVAKCKRGEVDLILTKSISRFGRNTLDVLRTLQKLYECEVNVWFEKENLYLDDRKMNFLITTYAAFAQAESENVSQNIKWGIRQGFRTGTSGYADFVCYGYKRGENGELAIDEHEAEVVRQIFRMRTEGMSLGKISEWLYDHEIPTPTRRARWSRETISKLLRNEKYVGDVLLQKTYVEDLFSGKQVKNTGGKDRFLLQEHHPAIVDRVLFEMAKHKI